jgi:hypothetical protein
MKLMTRFFLVLIFSFPFLGQAQNRLTREIELNEIKVLQLNLDEVFAVEIITGDFAKLKLISKSEGEYAQELRLDVNEIDETLHISSLFDAILTSGYDKLSSHKVISFQLKLYVPERLQVYLNSNIANVKLVGKLAYFEADLKSGACHLLKHEGNAKINTYRGDIEVETRDAEIKAETRSGTLQLQEANYKKYLLELKSVESNIEVIQLN